MLDAVVKHLVISITLTICIVCGQTCPPIGTMSPGNYAMVKAHESGDDPKDYLYLGGMFGVHYAGDSPGVCGGIRTRGIQNLEAFNWAVSTYQNRYPDALRSLRIGALAFDSCSDSFHLLQQLENFRKRLVGYGDPVVDPASLLGYVGPDRSGDAMTVASYWGTRGPPMVSHAATSGLLSNKKDYPYFMRTVPSDVVQVEALVKILLEQDWYYVQVIHSDNAYGNTGKDAFVSAARMAGICIVNEQAMSTEMDDAQINDILGSLMDNKDTRAVVVFANEDISRALLQAAGRQKARGLFTWFGTTAWAISSEVVKGVEQLAEGAVTLALESSQSQDDNLIQFMGYFSNLTPQLNQDNPWFREYWSEMFKCYFLGVPNPKNYNRLCDDMQGSLGSTEIDVYVPYTIKAVDAILNGLDKARREICHLSSDGLCDDLIKGEKWRIIFDSIISNADVFNQTTGDPVDAYYKIYNYRKEGTGCLNHCYTDVGDYSASNGFITMEAARLHSYDLFGMREYDVESTCNQKPCTVCGETPAPTATTVKVTTNAAAVTKEQSSKVSLRQDKWVIPLLVLACIGVLLVIIFDAYLLCKIFDTAYMKHWRTMWLGQLLLVAILLCYLTCFAFVVTPTKATCGIIRFGVGVSYAMCFSVLLVKLMILLSSESFGYLKGAFQVLMFLFAWGIQIVVDTEWLILRYPGTVPSADGSDMMTCEHGDFLSHVQSLVYIMLLILLCVGMAIRTSRISTNHREGVFIGLCAGFAIPIWLVWILVGVFYKDTTFRDPCLAYGLLATATIILFVMFLPKVRQLNSMGVEGIYAEDDSPSIAYGISNSVPGAPSVVGYTPSVMGYSNKAGPPSVIGYAPSKAGDGSVIFLPNGEVYGEPVKLQPVVATNPSALYLRHQGPLPGSHNNTLQRHHNLDTASIRSAPLGHGQSYVVRRTQPAQQSNGDTIHATTRVLRMTNELTGRKTPVLERKAISEMNFNPNVEYVINRPVSRNSENKSDLGKTTHKIADMGSL